MKAVSGKEFAKILERHGNQPLKPGLLRHLMKLAGITEDDL